MSLFDLVYDWVIHIVPNWLWWVLMAPLLLILAILLAGYFRPGLFG